MTLDDIKTKEQCAYQLVMAQRRLNIEQQNCEVLQQHMLKLEEAEVEKKPKDK